jgi:hypothetical protein
MTKIQRIEHEFGEPLKKIIKDFLTREDYFGKTVGLYHLPKILGISYHTCVKYIRKHKIKIPCRQGQNGWIPTHCEDVCWVKYGDKLVDFLKRNMNFFTIDEMAIMVDADPQALKQYMNDNGLHKQFVGMGRHAICRKE